MFAKPEPSKQLSSSSVALEAIAIESERLQ
jgi:hypothetical protein